MGKFDSEAFGSQIAEMVKSYVGTQFKALTDRIDALEATLKALPPAPELAPVELKIEVLSETVDQALADVKSSIPDQQAIIDAITETLPDIPKMVQDAVDSIPRPVDGLDGKSMTVEELTPVLQAMVDALPKAKDGQDGLPGRDGLDVKDLFRAEGGKLVAVMSDGTVKDLGTFVGKDGNDGFALEDLELEFDGERTLYLTFAKGDVKKEAMLRFPVMLYKGVFDEGRGYVEGDTVTYGGNLWHCNVKKTNAVPSRSEDWTMCAKKGRDGRDLVPKTVVATAVPLGGSH